MARENDADFADFVEQWSPALLRVAYLLTGDRWSAEDLLQAALLKTSRRWSKIADREAAYPYVRRVLVTTQASWLRRRRVPEVLIGQLPDDSSSHDDPVATPGRAVAALEALPPRMRAVIVLRYYEDLSEAETAAALGCSIGSVKSQASRGLARLRSVLTPGTGTTLQREEVR